MEKKPVRVVANLKRFVVVNKTCCYSYWIFPKLTKNLKSELILKKLFDILGNTLIHFLAES